MRSIRPPPWQPILFLADVPVLHCNHMRKPTVTITCLPYRSLKTIREALVSAWEQDYSGEIEILVREQGENDVQIALLHALAHKLGQTPTRSITITTGENLGFAGGHNALIRKARGEFVLLLNDDARLTQNYVSEAMTAFEDPKVGSVQGKLLRWDMNDLAQVVRTGDPAAPVIDTTGLLLLRNRRIINRGQGTEDRGQFDTQEEIWGPDGAVPIYRIAALDSVMFPRHGKSDELLDEDFFAYKEDVDLAWRLRWRNWKCVYVPTAVGWHGRSGGENAALSYREIIAERRKIAPLLKYYSFSNQRLLLLKNEDALRYLLDLPYWIIKEVGAWVYALLFERRTIPAIWRTIKLMPRILRKRRHTMSHKSPDANPYLF